MWRQSQSLRRLHRQVDRLTGSLRICKVHDPTGDTWRQVCGNSPHHKTYRNQEEPKNRCQSPSLLTSPLLATRCSHWNSELRITSGVTNVKTCERKNKRILGIHLGLAFAEILCLSGSFFEFLRARSGNTTFLGLRLRMANLWWLRRLHVAKTSEREKAKGSRRGNDRSPGVMRTWTPTTNISEKSITGHRIADQTPQNRRAERSKGRPNVSFRAT